MASPFTNVLGLPYGAPSYDVPAGASPDIAYLASRGQGVNAGQLNPDFASRLAALTRAAEAATGQPVSFSSFYRTHEQQAQIKANSLGQPVTWNGITYHPQNMKRGFAAAWPTKSPHESGMAADVKELNAAYQWMRAHAADYGVGPANAKLGWGFDPGHLQMAGGPAAYRTLNPNIPILRQGMSGAAVRALQSNLAAAGFSPGNIDGIFGPRTAATVKLFQHANGLAADSVAGPQTLAALGGGALQELAAPSGGSAVAPVSPIDYALGRSEPGAAAASPTFPSLWGEQPAPLGAAATKTVALGPSDYSDATKGSGEDNFARFMQQHAAPFTPASNQMRTGRSKWTDLAGVSEPILGMAQTSPEAFAAAQRASPSPPTFPAMFDRQTQPVGGSPAATASIPLSPPRPASGPSAVGDSESVTAAAQSGDPTRLAAAIRQFEKNYPAQRTYNVPPSLFSSTPLANQPTELQTFAPRGVVRAAPDPYTLAMLGDPSATAGPVGAAANVPLPPPRPTPPASLSPGGLPSAWGVQPANAGSSGGATGAPLSLDAIARLQAPVPNGNDPVAVWQRQQLAEALAQRTVPTLTPAVPGARPMPQPKQTYGQAFDQFGRELAGGIGNGMSNAARAVGNFLDPNASGGLGDASRWVRQQFGLDAAPTARPGPQSYNALPSPATSLLNQMLGVTPASAAELPGGPASASSDRFGGDTFADTPAHITPAGGPPGIAGVTFGGVPQSGMPGDFGAHAVAPAVAAPIVAYRPPTPPRSAPPQLVTPPRNAGAGLSAPGYNPNFGTTNPTTQGYINNYLGYGGDPPGPSGNYGSLFTPSGWNAPNYDPVSGGSTYAYTYNPQTGQGSYINSQGQQLNYSSF